MTRNFAEAQLGLFTATLERFKQELAPYLGEVVQNMGFEVAENIIVGGEVAPGTPIDTGFARSSWTVGINQPGEAILPPDNVEKRTYPEGGADMSAIATAAAGDEVYILNGASYIKGLEYGHSNQAPRGMVRLTLAAGQQLLDKVARKMTGHES